jgi:hypothetical protein
MMGKCPRAINVTTKQKKPRRAAVIFDCQVNRLIVVPLLFLAFAFGCAPQIRRIPAPPSPEAVSPLPLSISVLDDKIAYLEQILREERLSDEDTETAIDLLSAYKTVRAYLLKDSAADDRAEIIQTLCETLMRLDDGYFLKQQKETAPYPEAVTALSMRQDVIRSKYFSGDYRGVIDDIIELKTSFGPNVISLDIAFLAAASFVEVGMREEATILGGRLIREFEAKPDLAFIQEHLIEWQLDLRNRERVREIYTELTDHMDEIMQGSQAGDLTEGLFQGWVEQKIQRERDARGGHKEDPLTRAREMIEGERYEEAIKIIDELGEGHGTTLEMEELKDLAIEEIIKRERNRAATSLLRARQTTDPIKKKELLLLSYNRLKALTEQYPTSNLVEKLNRDMETVKTELDKLETTPEY